MQEKAAGPGELQGAKISGKSSLPGVVLDTVNLSLSASVARPPSSAKTPSGPGLSAA